MHTKVIAGTRKSGQKDIEQQL